MSNKNINIKIKANSKDAEKGINTMKDTYSSRKYGMSSSDSFVLSRKCLMSLVKNIAVIINKITSNILITSLVRF